MSIYRKSMMGALVMGLLASASSAVKVVTGIGEDAVVPTFSTAGTPRHARNGGRASGAAAAKRAAKRRRNIAKRRGIR